MLRINRLCQLKSFQSTLSILDRSSFGVSRVCKIALSTTSLRLSEKVIASFICILIIILMNKHVYLAYVSLYLSFYTCVFSIHLCKLYIC